MEWMPIRRLWFCVVCSKMFSVEKPVEKKEEDE